VIGGIVEYGEPVRIFTFNCEVVVGREGQSGRTIVTYEDKESVEPGESRQRWVSEVQEALERAGDAVRTAWEATRESRMSALESAKQATKELGDVIEKGRIAAKERWTAGEEADSTMPPPPTEDPDEP
jgi:hypothetical protein